MARPLNTQEIRRLKESADPYLEGVRDLVDSCKFHYQALNAGAAALPAQLGFFNVAQVPGVCNMEIANQVIYPIWITHMGFQAWGTGDDVRIAVDSGQIRIIKDNRAYCDLPCNVLGAGGLRMQYSEAIAGVPVDFGTNGQDDQLFMLPTPIKIDPDQVLQVLYLSNLEPTVDGAVAATIILRGVEARSVI